jgi:PucR family transcriptional regulator, purine catabolism regulatory protein
MPLWLEHLLEDPGLALELVAGHGGLRSRGPIRWVHISEIPDPTPWLEGGEVLLTTGLSLAESPELQRKLVAGLDARGCTAVGYGVGVCTEEVPEALRDEADARDLPVFTVPYAVPFIAVTKRISRHIFEEHYATLRSAVDLHRQVLATVLSGAGMGGVLAALTRTLPDFSCTLFDYYGQVLGAQPAATPDAERLWDRVGPALRGQERAEVATEDGVAVGATVRIADQVEAYLVVSGRRHLHEHERLLLEQGLMGVSLELARGHSARQAHRTTVEELLEEVWAGRLGSQPLARKLERLGLDTSDGYTVLAVVGAPGESSTPRERSLVVVAEDALATTGTPILGRIGGSLHAIVPGDGAVAARAVVEALRRRGWPHAVVGRSRLRRDVDGLVAALREAEVASSSTAVAPTGVRDVETLGLTGLLAGIDDALGADAFIHEILGPVLAHDEAEGSNLAETLRAYQQHGCRPGPAAEQLCIHRHTLAYRLDRIRDLTGRDPRDGAHLLAFGLALELRERSRG